MNPNDILSQIQGEVVTAKRLAKLLGCSTRTITREIERGRLEAFHHTPDSRLWIITKEELRSYLEQFGEELTIRLERWGKE